MLRTSLAVLGLAVASLVTALPAEQPAAPALPDFARYIDVKTLTRKDLGTDDAHRRIVFVGDIHGMIDSLHRLLGKVKYDPRRDTIIHTGDIITKGFDSLGTLEWLSSNKILGVRGNQDERVIEWRGWIEWVSAQRGGAKWLEHLKAHYEEPTEGRDIKKKHRSRHWRIPNDWVFNGEHYQLAQNMTAKHYNYLLNLPLTLHLAPLHTFVGHAGMLPMDPTRKPTAKQQPLSHVPEVDHPKPPTRLLRLAQEVAVRHDIPQNINPWSLLNMRSIRGDGTVTRDGETGEPWSNLWNAVMGMCVGFASVADDQSPNFESQLVLSASSKGKVHLPCHPSTVVYGHAASRGLDLKRWTKGLDSGCVYGRKLSALVLGSRGKHFDDIDDTDDLDDDDMEVAQRTTFGERRKGRIVRVRCPEAAE